MRLIERLATSSGYCCPLAFILAWGDQPIRPLARHLGYSERSILRWKAKAAAGTVACCATPIGCQKTQVKPYSFRKTVSRSS
jgi:hypothetical protein